VDAPPGVKIATIEAGAGNALAAPPEVKPATIQVVDAHGKQVGNVVGIFFGYTTVALRVKPVPRWFLPTLEEQDVLLNVLGADSIQGWNTIGAGVGQTWFGANGFVFESDDCSGTPFLSVPDGLLLPNTVVSTPGMTVYVPDQSAPARQVVVRSSISVEFGAPGNCSKVTINVSASPAIPLIDLLTVYTPPFRIVFADTSAAGGGTGITATIHLPGCTLTIQGGIIVDATSTIPFSSGTCP
jgi:hypothetical protein